MSDAECPTCGRDDFNTEADMKIHHNKSHGVSLAGVPIECDWCGERRRVKAHRVERNEKNFCKGTECYGKWRLENWQGENHPLWDRIEVECAWCGQLKCVPPGRLGRIEKHFCNEKCKRKWQSENLRGENHPRWQGGKFPYGPGWNEEKKEAVRERDGRECQHCGRSEAEHLELYGYKHHVHHIQKARHFDDPEKRNAMDNLITLCHGECHTTWERMSPMRPQIAPADD